MQTQTHQPDYILFFTVVILSAVGVLTVYSASTVVALHGGLSASHYAVRQFAAAALGIILLSVFSRIPHHTWYRSSALIMGVNLVLLAMVLIPGLGHSAYGGRRWIGTSSIHLQPSELAIMSIVIYLSFFFTKKVTVLHNVKLGLRPALILIVVNFVLILMEPDLGTGVTLLGTALVILMVSGARLKPLLVISGVVPPAILLLALISPYRMQRILSFLHPFKHAGGSAYQVVQGWTGMAAGGWFGRGFDMSIEKTGYLPFPQTDFIFPVFVEEWGFLGAVALMVVFGVLIWRGFTIARHSADRFGALLAVGMTSMITITTLINLAAVTGLMPVTGIPLPFISYGGTALIVNLSAMGILLSISRHTLAEEPEADHLANVVPVEEARTRRHLPRLASMPTKVSDARTRRKPAEVHKLQSHIPNPSSQAWRARSEVSATRDTTSRRAKGQGRGSTLNGVATTEPSWRTRNQSTPTVAKPPRGKKTDPQKSIVRPKPFRKDK